MDIEARAFFFFLLSILKSGYKAILPYFIAKAQFGHFELTLSLCLVAPYATLTTNPSVGISANNSPANHSLCHCLTSRGLAVLCWRDFKEPTF
jgi:hypothetical protein